MNPTQTTLIELRDDIASGRVTAVQAVRAYLDRIEKLNPLLNAYREVYPERALQQAEAVDAKRVTGPLAGVPIALKDNLCTDYGRTSCSSRMLEDFRAPYNATAVLKLEAAGAVILGKTNMDEFAMGSSCEWCAFGRVHNPWDRTRIPGGSSGGSAAAMAADLCAAALGSDTGGSIRQPGAMCGVVGLKPTYGRISRWGLVPFASSLDQIGPITRTVADAALLLEVMTGHDPLDSTSAKRQAEPGLHEVDTPLEGLRLGVARQYLVDWNDKPTDEAINQAIEQYRELGAEIVDVDLPHTEYGISTYYIVATAEASSNLARYDGVHYGHRARDARDLIQLYSQSRSEGFGDEVKRRIMLGTYALSSGYYDAYYLRALKVRRLIKQDFDAAFERCHAIICPTSPTVPFRLGERLDNPVQMYMADMYTAPASLAGIAAISMPGPSVAMDGQTLPVGVQLLAPAFEEHALLRIAHQYQANTPYHNQRPVMQT